MFVVVVVVIVVEEEVVVVHPRNQHLKFAKIFCPKNIRVKSILSKKEYWSTKIKAPKKLGTKSLVKIRSVTSYIMLIWINVTRTYAAWTIVTMTVKEGPSNLQLNLVKIVSLTYEILLPGQMSPWQLESVLYVPINLPLKFGQNRVSNS